MSDPIDEWDNGDGDDEDEEISAEEVVEAEANIASEDVETSIQVIGSTDVKCSASIYFSAGINCCAGVLFCVDISCRNYMFCNREMATEDEWYSKLKHIVTIFDMPTPGSEISFDEFWLGVTNLMWFELLEVDGMDSALLAEVSGIDEEEILGMAGLGFQEKLISIGAILKKDE